MTGRNGYAKAVITLLITAAMFLSGCGSQKIMPLSESISAVSGFHAGTIKADNTTLYFLTVREGSVSSKTDTVEKIKTRIEVTAAVEKYLRDHGFCMEDKYRVEKIDMRMIALLKKDFFEGVKEFIYLYRQGIAIMPIIGKMLMTFIGNRIR